MLISEFARATGLTTDTVRFYVRIGLLRPGASAKGGRRAYQAFTETEVQAARIIRLSQAVGLSLAEIAALAAERRQGRITRERRIEVVDAQLARIEARVAELAAMADYLRAKRDWLAGVSRGVEPAVAFTAKAGHRHRTGV